MEDKKVLREKYIKIRNDIEDKLEKSGLIFNKIISLSEYKNANIIGLYNSIGSEVNTSEMIEYFISDDKIVCLPRVFGDDLKFYRIYSLNDKFEKSKFNVLEPIIDSNNYIDVDKIDLLLVPGVCFDVYKNRLGYGKGYYDRYLENADVMKIGICYEEQIISKLPVSNNDVRLDKVITDKRTYE